MVAPENEYDLTRWFRESLGPMMFLVIESPPIATCCLVEVCWLVVVLWFLLFVADLLWLTWPSVLLDELCKFLFCAPFLYSTFCQPCAFSLWLVLVSSLSPLSRQSAVNRLPRYSSNFLIRLKRSSAWQLSDSVSIVSMADIFCSNLASIWELWLQLEQPSWAVSFKRFSRSSRLSSLSLPSPSESSSFSAAAPSCLLKDASLSESLPSVSWWRTQAIFAFT